MHFEADGTDSPGVQGRELASIDWGNVGCTISACARGLNPCHVREIGKLTRRSKPSDEARKVIAITCEQRRARRMLDDESVGHHLEELVARDLLDYRKATLENFYQPRHHIIAVNGKAPRRDSGAGNIDSER